jgi:hypothetical protein
MQAAHFYFLQPRCATRHVLILNDPERRAHTRWINDDGTETLCAPLRRSPANVLRSAARLVGAAPECRRLVHPAYGRLPARWRPGGDPDQKIEKAPDGRLSFYFSNSCFGCGGRI